MTREIGIDLGMVGVDEKYLKSVWVYFYSDSYYILPSCYASDKLNSCCHFSSLQLTNPTDQELGLGVVEQLEQSYTVTDVLDNSLQVEKVIGLKTWGTVIKRGGFCTASSVVNDVQISALKRFRATAIHAEIGDPEVDIPLADIVGIGRAIKTSVTWADEWQEKKKNKEWMREYRKKARKKFKETYPEM